MFVLSTSFMFTCIFMLPSVTLFNDGFSSSDVFNVIVVFFSSRARAMLMFDGHVIYIFHVVVALMLMPSTTVMHSGTLLGWHIVSSMFELYCHCLAFHVHKYVKHLVILHVCIGRHGAGCIGVQSIHLADALCHMGMWHIILLACMLYNVKMIV